MFDFSQRSVLLASFFVLISLVSAVLFALKIVKIGGQEGYRIIFITKSAEGLSEGSPVVLNGVKVGKVERIRLSSDGRKVIVEAKIEKGVKIAKDSHVRLKTRGVLGDKYVSILQGEEKEYLSDGDVVFVEDVGELEKIFERTADVLEGIGDVIKNFSQLVSSVAKIVESVERNFTLVSESISETSSEVADFFRVSRIFVEKLSLYTEKTFPYLITTLDNLSSASSNIKVASANISEISFLAKSISHKVERIIGEVEKGEGGRIIFGDEWANFKSNVETSIESIRSASEKISKIWIFDTKVRGELELGLETSQKAFVSSHRIGAKFEDSNFFADVGIQTPPGINSLTFDLLLGYSAEYFNLFAGFYRSSPSLGLSLKIFRTISLNSQLLNLSLLERTNLRTFFQVKKDFLLFRLGAENLLFSPIVFFGAGFEK